MRTDPQPWIPGWVLAVVTRAATQRTVSIHEAANVLKLVEPYLYRLDRGATARRALISTVGGP